MAVIKPKRGKTELWIEYRSELGTVLEREDKVLGELEMHCAKAQELADQFKIPIKVVERAQAFNLDGTRTIHTRRTLVAEVTPYK